MIHRRALPALSVAVLLAACSSGGGSSAKDTAPTLAQAQAAAAAINLTAADAAAGFTGTAHDQTSSDDADTAKLAQCAGAPVPKTDQVADLYSDDFGSGAQISHQQVNSDVTVFSNKTHVHADVAAFQGGKAAGCIRTFIADAINKEASGAPGLRVSAPVVTALHPDGGGLDGAFGFSVTATITAGPVTVPVEFVLQGVAAKHCEIALETSAIGPAFSKAERDRLWTLLLQRAKKSAV